MRRTKAEAEQTRQDLLEAALKLFDEQGYEKTTLADIAKAAGVTRGAFYWHFKNKSELFNELSERHIANFREQLNTIVNQVNTWDHLAEILINFLTELQTSPDKSRFSRIVQSEPLHPDIQAIFVNYRDMWTNAIAVAIKNSSERGEIQVDIDPQWAQIHLGVTLSGIIDHLMCPKRPGAPVLNTYIPSIIHSTIAMIRDGRQVQ
ncbi:TetR/AcrR family transcriptional regulator [Cardiobacteriaceae bacterium TAE3-ERU3]|nr:TetR/AcrR family transcriptional regulator [Cardiobacteriaceae bacterium TAE3-ERU3]